MGRWRAAPKGLRNGQLSLHPGLLMPGLVAEERVLAGREIVDRKRLRVARLYELARRDAVVVAVPNDEVVRRRSRVDQPESHLAGRNDYGIVAVSDIVAC